eukprot:TRINITY_DN15200_c0_g2_i2.p1 TRINITY_DN15200_c0_g2~~TRINITY_DN15200_c0_g2_i2.p1  ORF type:complete len:389 (+),score=77.68 TRINITY_DN15200_c0_g2_i2:98-1264(+)
MARPHDESTVLFPPPGVVKTSSSDVLTSFSVLRGDRQLRVGNHSVPIDTAALSSRSLYFASMFGSEFKEATSAAEVTVDAPEEETFFHVLYYLMTGTLRDLTVANFASVVANADFVQSEQLVEYLQQVAVAYHKQLFAHPSFRPPRISSEFVKGFLRHAQAAKKLRSLFAAVHLISPWLDADAEQAATVLEYARTLFPLPPRTVEYTVQDDLGKAAGKGMAGLGLAERNRRAQERRVQEQDQRLDHLMTRASSAFHFVQAMLKYPSLGKQMNAEEALRAIDPIVHETGDSSYHQMNQMRYGEPNKRRKVEKIDKMKSETRQCLSQLCKKLHPPGAENDERRARILAEMAAQEAALFAMRGQVPPPPPDEGHEYPYDYDSDDYGYDSDL